jgi:hypothetical protein
MHGKKAGSIPSNNHRPLHVARTLPSSSIFHLTDDFPAGEFSRTWSTMHRLSFTALSHPPRALRRHVNTTSPCSKRGTEHIAPART